ncbi:MAG: hypothetical protein CGW95_00675 [Phenylobacterium zucineum]|nr:MAG: hypothetical protein CGW95_00675 [Phenylobacterium zucineum]
MTDNDMLAFPALKVPHHPAAIAMLVQPALNALIGTHMVPVSMTLDMGVSVDAGESVEVEVKITRRTRTLVFAQARVLKAPGQLAADISTVFRLKSELGPSN